MRNTPASLMVDSLPIKSMNRKIVMSGFVTLLVLFQYLTASSIREMSIQGDHREWRVPNSGDGSVPAMLESLTKGQRQLDATLVLVGNGFLGKESENDNDQNESNDLGNDLKILAERFPTRLEDAWSCLIEDMGNHADELLFDEQLERFEASLTKIGREELRYRVDARIQQLAMGRIPGFEDLGTYKPEDVAFHTAEESALTPRQQKLRNGIFKNFKRISLIEMHETFTGLVGQ